ncbi:hypothetical protein J6590_041099 [Homalodisca vitripennis]|nr:hypothetical protein J6590_041099 [Homalodisca vitripennis]
MLIYVNEVVPVSVLQIRMAPPTARRNHLTGWSGNLIVRVNRSGTRSEIGYLEMDNYRYRKLLSLTQYPVGTVDPSNSRLHNNVVVLLIYNFTENDIVDPDNGPINTNRAFHLNS